MYFELCSNYVDGKFKFIPVFKHSSNSLWDSQYYVAPVKHEISYCFIIPGNFLLLSSSPAAEASGTCEYHLTSPVLPGSNSQCVLQLALYKAGPAVGNLTLLIKPVLSSAAVRSVVLTQQRQDDHRSANTLRSSSQSFCDVFVQKYYLFCGVLHHLCST